MLYADRVLDSALSDLLKSLPVIAIEGPRAVGKTETATRRAATLLALDDPSALAKSDPPPLVRRSPGRDRRSIDRRCVKRGSGQQLSGPCSSGPALVDYGAEQSSMPSRGLARGGATGAPQADEVASEGNRAVGTGVEDERDAVAPDGAAEPERLLDELGGHLSGGDGGHEVVGAQLGVRGDEGSAGHLERGFEQRERGELGCEAQARDGRSEGGGGGGLADVHPWGSRRDGP